MDGAAALLLTVREKPESYTRLPIRVPPQGNFLESMQVLEAQLRLEVCLLQAGLEGVQEATSVCTVDHTVIVGEGQVAHGADSDNVVTVNILNNHGALHDGTGTEDCNVRLVDDRGVEQRTEGTNVGDGEGRTRQLLGGRCRRYVHGHPGRQ